MSDEILRIEDAPLQTAGVRLLTLHRPERRNALSPELVAALIDALRAADADPAVRALVLTGAGDQAFCAGGDLGAPSGDGFLGMHEDRGRFAELLCVMRGMRRPMVAAVGGLALGGGFGLVLACDLAIASSTASFGTPEVKRGLFPMMIGRLLYEVLPRKAANELIFLGERISAVQALDLGVINAVVAADEVLASALEMAGRVAALSPAVVGLGRRALNRQLDLPHDAAIAHLHDQLTLNTQLEDAAEGVMAFFEKRDPVFRGR